MNDPNPTDQFNGLMAFAKDASGEVRYLMPITIGTKSIETSFFLNETTPAAVPIAPGSNEAKALTQWLEGERGVLAEAIAARKTALRCVADIAAVLLAIRRGPKAYLAARAVIEAASGDLVAASVYAGVGVATRKFNWKIVVKPFLLYSAAFVLYDLVDKGPTAAAARVVKLVVPSDCQSYVLGPDAP
jgi:hypothetical protein